MSSATFRLVIMRKTCNASVDFYVSLKKTKKKDTFFQKFEIEIEAKQKSFLLVI